MSDKKKILVVEDRPEIRMLVGLTVKPWGYEVIEAETSDAGLLAVRNHKPDLVLLDVMMPGSINGFDICRVLKQDNELRMTPVVMMTALAQQSDIAEGRDAGADDYIVKPFSVADLREVITRFLGKPRTPEKPT